MSKISKHASEDLEEEEASDSVDPSSSRDSRLVKLNPLHKVNDKHGQTAPRKVEIGASRKGLKLTSDSQAAKMVLISGR